MKNLKRLIAVILTVLMLAQLAPVNALSFYKASVDSAETLPTPILEPTKPEVGIDNPILPTVVPTNITKNLIGEINSDSSFDGTPTSSIPDTTTEVPNITPLPTVIAIPPTPITTPSLPKHQKEEKKQKGKVGDINKKRIIVKYKSTQNADEIKDSVFKARKLSQMNKVKEIKKRNLDVYEIGDNDSIDSVISEFKKSNEVEYVQEDSQLNILAIPDNIEGKQIQYLKNGGLNKANSDVVIGIMDTGIDTGNKNLSDNIWSNTSEIPNNGVDDDKNGKIDDINGWDFVNDDNTVFDSPDSDTHGTIVAGIATASVKEEGSSDKRIKILPLKFMIGDSGRTSDAIEAIEYAKAMGVGIINASWGSTQYNPALKEAMKDSGILFICSAGNSGQDVAVNPVYPANYKLPNVLSVAAVDNKGELAEFSNYGSGVDIAAPGVYVSCIGPENSQTTTSGTSAAAAYVTGVAALLKGSEPGLSAEEMLARIKNNAVKSESLEGKVITGGTVDAGMALENKSGKPDVDGNPPVRNNPETGVTEDNLNQTMAEVDPKLMEQLHYGEQGVFPATGNYSRTEVDMSVNSPGFWMDISRTYNSKNTSSNNALGPGWTFGFEGKLYAPLNSCYSTVTAVLPNGSAQSFFSYNNTYRAVNNRSKLEKLPDGGYLLTTKDQCTYKYNISALNWTWYLSEITDRNGNKITIDLTVVDIWGNTKYSTEVINKISDNTGRYFIVEHFDPLSCGIRYVREYINGAATGRVIEYQYANGTLSSVIDSTGNIIRYNYIYQNVYNYLSEVKDKNNNIIESITYANYVSDEDIGKVSTLKDKLGNVFTYNYENIIGFKTTITDSSQRKVTKWYDGNYNIIKSTDPEVKDSTADYKYGTWTAKGSLNIARNNLEAVELNGKIYAIGGYSNKVEGSMEAYDPLTNKWTIKAGMQTPRQYFAVAVANGKIYVMGGRNSIGETIGTVEAYDPITDKWTSKANMPTAREGHGAATVNGRIYVIGGNSAVVDEFNPVTNTWTSKSSMPTRRSYLGVAAVNNKIYAIGGTCSGGESGGRSRSVEEYDPISDTWTIKQEMAFYGRYDFASVVVSGVIYVVGGYHDSNILDDSVTRYDPVLDQWSVQGCRMSAAKVSLGAAVLNDEIYALGGYGSPGGYLSAVEAMEIPTAVFGEIKSVTDRNGNKYDYKRDFRGNIIKQTNPDGTYKQYAYDDKNNLTMEKDELGKTTWYVYDSYKINLMKKVQPLNGSDEYIDGVSNDANFAITTYQYYTDTEYQTLGYKIKGLVKSMTDPEGNTTNYTYDSNGNVETISDPETNKTSIFGYNAIGWKTLEISPDKKQTRFMHDNNGNLEMTKKILCSAPITTVPVDYPTGGNSFSMYLHNHAQNSDIRFVTVTDKSLVYGVPVTNSDTYDVYVKPNAEVKAWKWDGSTWVTDTDLTKTFTTEQKILSSYCLEDSSFNLKTSSGEILKTYNSTTRYIYDAEGRVTQEVPPNLYDPENDGLNSNPVTHTYSNNTVGTRYTYYDSGKINTKTDAENNTTTYTYDLYGNVATETRPNDSTYTYDYDVMNRPGKVYFKDNSTASPVLLEEYEYTVQDDKTAKKTQKKHLNSTETAVTSYIYDYAGRLIHQQNPDNTNVYTSYNANGTVNTTTDAKNNITYYKYDGLNRLTEKWTPFETVNNSTMYSYSYTEYDKTGKVKVEKTGKDMVALYDIPSVFITKNYDYYRNGKLKMLADSSGKKSNYYYDYDGNLKKEELYTQTTPTEKIIVTEYINNYFGKPDIKKVHVQAGDIYGNDFSDNTDCILQTSYEYDKNGNMIAETAPDGVKKTYTYDKMDRQTGVSQPGQDENGLPVDITTSVTYNWEGKPLIVTDARLNKTENTYNQRGLLEKVTTKVTLNGVLTDCITAYEYDLAERKVKEVSPANYDSAKTMSQMNRIEYIYDLMGRLKLKQYVGDEITIDANTKQFVTGAGKTIALKAYKYDDNGNIAKELDGKGYESITEGTIDDKINSGYGTEYTYNFANKVKTVLDAVSKDESLTYNLKYEYDAAGRKTKETGIDGVIKVYYYDDAGNVIKTSVKKTENDPEQDLQVNTYDLAGNVTSTKDGNKNLITYEYNYLNKLRKETHPGDATIPSNTINYQYDVMGNVKSKSDSTGVLDTYTYDNQGRQLSYTQKRQDGTEGITTYSRYDKNGNKRFEIDGNGIRKDNTYNEDNKLISTRISGSSNLQPFSNGDLTGRDASFTLSGNILTGTRLNTAKYWDAGFFPASVKEWQFEVMQRSIWVVLGGTDSEFTAIGLGPADLGNIVDFHSDGSRSYRIVHPFLSGGPANGDVINISVSSGVYYFKIKRAGQSTFEDWGTISKALLTNVTNWTNETLGLCRSYSGYEDAGICRNVYVQKRTHTTINSYDRNGNILTQTDRIESGSIVSDRINRNKYDPLDRLIEKIDPNEKSVQKIEYDHNNAQIKSYDALGNLTQFSYDNNGRLSSTIDPKIDPILHKTSQTYDSRGRIHTKKDGRQNVTEYSYNELGKLKSVLNAKNETTEYTYDLNGNLLTQTDGKVFEYNAANKLVKRIDNGGRTGTPGNYVYDMTKVETYTYYADGSLKQKVDKNGATTTYVYDIHGRLKTQTTEKTGSTTVAISNTYDDNGNKLTVTDSIGTTTRTYDELNRTITKDVPNIGKSTYTYDIISGVPEGCVGESIKDPKNNITTKVYDNAGRLSTVTADGRTTTYNYFDNGSRRNVIYFNGATEEYTYYADNLLWTLTNKRSDGSVMDVYTYTYDAAHNQESKTETVNGTSKGTTSYTYDALNRLERVTEPSGRVTTYTYDTAGNRDTETITSGAITTVNKYNYNNQNRLTGIVTKVNNTVTETDAYTYDNNGNQLTLSRDGNITATNTYDLLNQLVTTTTDGKAITNKYNGEGLRVEKTVGGQITRYLYEYDQVVLEVDGSGNQTGRNVYGTNLLTRTAGGQTVYYMYNGHGDVTALMDASTNKIVAGYSYDEWGQQKDGNEVDGEFETDLNSDGKDDNWSFTAGFIGTSQSSTIKKTGTKSQKLTTTSSLNASAYKKDYATQTGHKYMFAGYYYIVTKNGNLSTRVNSDGTAWNLNLGSMYWPSTLNQWKQAGVIFTAASTKTTLIPCFVDPQVSEVYLDNWKLIDLTAIYGAGNEPTTIDAAQKDYDNSIRYAGYQYDKETGLYYLNARMYDPKIARFLQEDTYTGDPNDPLSLNLYTYCHNEPIMYTDPTGHKEKGDVLIMGNSGDDVALLQKRLESEGYFKLPSGASYGTFGNVTYKALKDWQEDHGLDADGAAGDKSWSKLGLKFEEDPYYSNQYNQILNYEHPTAIDVNKVTREQLASVQVPGDVKAKISPVNYGKKNVTSSAKTSTQGTSNSSNITNTLGSVNTVATLAKAGTSIYINSAIKSGSLSSKSVNVFTDAVLPACVNSNTGSVVDTVQKSLDTGKDMRKLAPAATSAKSKAILYNVKEAGNVFKIASDITLVSMPVLEIPSGLEANKNAVPDDVPGSQILNVTAGVADAFSFGWIRSIAKTPNIITIIPDVVPKGVKDALKDYNNWVDNNINAHSLVEGCLD